MHTLAQSFLPEPQIHNIQLFCWNASKCYNFSLTNTKLMVSCVKTDLFFKNTVCILANNSTIYPEM